MVNKYFKILILLISVTILGAMLFNTSIRADQAPQTCWDGCGLKGFMDYVNNGEEHVNVEQQSLTILSKVYTVKSLGWTST